MGLGWFPVVGSLLGAFAGGIYIGLSELMPAGPAAAVSIAVGLLVTGAFHLDGLADMADAFGGGWDRAQRLEILKDSRLGTYGVTALAMVLLIEWSSLANLAGWSAFAAVVASQTLGRMAAVIAMRTVPRALESGSGFDYAAHASMPAVTGACIWGVGVAILCFGVWAPIVLFAVLVVVVAISALAVSKIGGLVGDVLGAIAQLCVAAVMLCAVALV